MHTRESPTRWHRLARLVAFLILCANFGLVLHYTHTCNAPHQGPLAPLAPRSPSPVAAPQPAAALRVNDTSTPRPAAAPDPMVAALAAIMERLNGIEQQLAATTAAPADTAKAAAAAEPATRAGGDPATGTRAHLNDLTTILPKTVAPRLLVVVATYRSGSTTVMHMLDQLPDTCVAGENAGMTQTLLEQYERTVRTGFASKTGPWQHHAVSVESILRAQRAYVTAQLSCPNDVGTIGFKTIRMKSAREAQHLSRIFPDTAFVVVRCVAQQSTHVNDVRIRRCKEHNKMVDVLKTVGVRVVDTLSLKNFTLQKFNGLARQLLRNDVCHYHCVVHSNKCNGTGGSCYEPDLRKCLHCDGSVKAPAVPQRWAIAGA